MGKIYKNGIEYGGGGGDSAGHIILDNDGTAMAEEPNLQFKGLNVTDNSTDEITEVESAGLNQDSMDDVLNASISGNQVASNGLVYSTEEQVVGKWVDGKPIYQKTFQLNTLVDGNVFLTGVDTLIDNEYVVIRTDGASQNSIGVTSNNEIQSGFFIAKKADGGVAPYNRGSLLASSAIVTVRYTKTTD